MNDTQTKSPLLTVDDVIERLAISRKTLYSIRKEGKLTAILINGCVRFTEQEIERFINDSADIKPVES